jgi:hypothetical protein
MPRTGIAITQINQLVAEFRLLTHMPPDGQGVAIATSGKACEGPSGITSKRDPNMRRLRHSNCVAQQDSVQCGRLGRRARVSAIFVGAVACVFLASAVVFADAAENSPRAAQVQHACAVVMGLEPGELYDTCVRSLNRSLSDLDQARRMSAGRSTCAGKGLKPGTAAFGDCVVDATYGVR